MEEIVLAFRGHPVGTVILIPEGVRVCVRAAMPDLGDGLYRAFLLGEGEELLLGVMEPCEGELRTCRRVYRRDLDRLGGAVEGEVRCSFLLGQEVWQESACPGELFRDPFLRSRLGGQRQAWWRREGEMLRLALPLERDRPFPLPALFCLAQVERIMGKRCAVFTFRGEEPVLP